MLACIGQSPIDRHLLLFVAVDSAAHHREHNDGTYHATGDGATTASAFFRCWSFLAKVLRAGAVRAVANWLNTSRCTITIISDRDQLLLASIFDFENAVVAIVPGDEVFLRLSLAIRIAVPRDRGAIWSTFRFYGECIAKLCNGLACALGCLVVVVHEDPDGEVSAFSPWLELILARKVE